MWGCPRNLSRYSLFMKHSIILLFLICIFSPLGPAYAQEKITQETAPSEPAEHIKKLIETLENESARKDLIANLNTLLEAQPNKDTNDFPPVALTEQLGIRDTVSNWVNKYEKFLNKNTISPSFFHQAIGTIITFAIGLSLFLGGQKIAKKIITKIDHLSEKIGLKLTRISFYTRVFQILMRFIIIGMMAYTFSKIWGFDKASKIFEGQGMQSFLTSSVTILFVAILAALIWEAVGIYLSYILKQADDKNHTRVKTLLPLIRNLVLSVFALLFGLVIMSEIGLNVAPFIAGAGVIGLAIGFGAQSMVKDFITGITIVIEDVIRVGDVVSMADCTGLVERITLRKVQLRDFAGIVYTIPFSQITTIQNMTKNFSYYPLEIGVAYKENIDKVMQIMRRIDTEMQGEETYKTMMLDPIEIVGVERFEDNAVIIKARMKTVPIKQWDVGREYNRRLKMAFDSEGIEMPFPQRVITIKNEKELETT